MFFSKLNNQIEAILKKHSQKYEDQIRFMITAIIMGYISGIIVSLGMGFFSWLSNMCWIIATGNLIHLFVVLRYKS